MKKASENQLKRVFFITLCIIVFISCVPVSTFGANDIMCTESGCTGLYENGICSLDSSHYEAPLKNKSGYYEIGNAGQLYWFALAVNGGETAINAILTEDITVNRNLLESIENDEDGNITNGEAFIPWNPIGYYVDSADNVYYNGKFDGGGHIISGLYVADSEKSNVGFFGRIDVATIQNVGVVDSYFYGKNSVGGVCGSGNNGSFLNCYNESEVKGSSYIGGICGNVDKGLLENCYNKGKITGLSVDTGGVAGVIGNNSVTVKGCYNTGEIVGVKNVSGVVANNCSKIIDGCYNTGSVSGTGEKIGGIVGHNSGSACINNSYNSGKIKGDDYYVGGIAGDNLGKIQNCYNTGEISNTVELFKMSYVGGVSGRNYGGTISQCYNKGDIICVGNAVGGICGNNYRTASNPVSVIENCYNAGSLKSGANQVGGICGINSSANCYIKNCHNVGTIIGWNMNVGGVCGLANTNSCIENCYYLFGCATDKNSTFQSGIGSSSYNGTSLDTEGLTVKTGKQFANGEVAYLLQSVQVADEKTGVIPQVWGQESDAEGSYPILTGNCKYKVIKIENGGYSVAGKGDVNGDGVISTEDYQLSVNTALSTENTLTDAEDKETFARVDVNSDTVVDVLDVAFLEKMINGHC